MRSPQRFCHLALLAGAVLLWNVPSACALEDGFNYDKKIEGKYITVYCAPGLDVPHLMSQLNIHPSDQILAGQSRKPEGHSSEALAPMLDTLFLKVSNILDMHLYSLRTDLKICNTNEELSDIYRRLFNASLGGRRSFYVYDLNSIYVSADAFQPGIIGHEMSHAIIGHYFGIPAPVKVQEVLAMYVEYTLKK